MRTQPDLVFRDRRDAGRALADALRKAGPWRDPVVLALPRGGVPVAFEVAQALGAPLDILVVRKIGHPRHEEFAIGAIAGGGVTVMNPQADGYLGGVSAEDVDRIVQRERAELERREHLYRDGRPAEPLAGRDVIVVDDGLATGSTMRAAVAALRRLQPARVVVAVPVGAQESCDAVGREADAVVCVRSPQPFYAVGAWYAEFPQTGDGEVRGLLAQARQGRPA